MEILLNDHQEVADPDHGASGRAGTGQGLRIVTGIVAGADRGPGEPEDRPARYPADKIPTVEAAGMTRRATTVQRDIPLYLPAHIVQREVRINSKELEWVIVRKTRSHFYNVSVRTSPINRELKGKCAATRGEVRAKEKESGDAT